MAGGVRAEGCGRGGGILGHCTRGAFKHGAARVSDSRRSRFSVSSLALRSSRDHPLIYRLAMLLSIRGSLVPACPPLGPLALRLPSAAHSLSLPNSQLPSLVLNSPLSTPVSGLQLSTPRLLDSSTASDTHRAVQDDRYGSRVRHACVVVCRSRGNSGASCCANDSSNHC